ncbi:alcohol dehydrogenase [Haliangium sp.]|uniref:alcohol dehydrogenase n=1 Tax=Haliangium sp. TaxID=2663208 RepID=UPI003D0F5A68
MAKMKAAQVSKVGGPFEIVERDIPDPGAGQVRIRVAACGICHSDAMVKEGYWPGIDYPRVPGHEVVGVVDAVGAGVQGWSEGDRVGAGWHGGHCFHCQPCRRGDFVLCQNGKVSGISHDGGYAEYMVAPAESLARVPEGLDSHKAAPLLCAGITVYNALRHTSARPGDLVAVQGIGGLGHLGVQFAAQMGFRTVALSRGPDKESFAREMGAHDYVDVTAGNPAKSLQGMGGAKVILATAPNSEAIAALVGGLGLGGQLLIVAATNEPLTINPLALLSGRRSILGWPSGTATDSEDTMAFAGLTGVEPLIETFPLDQANQAYERMITNQARFRAVLTMTD